MTNSRVNDASIENLLHLMDAREFVRAYSGIQALLEDSDRIKLSERTTLRVLAAECLAYLGRSDEASALALPLSDTLKDSSDHNLYGRACVALAIANYSLGNMRLAGDYAQTSYFAFKRVDDVLGMIKAQNWSGNVHFYLGEYTKAIDCHAEAMRLASSLSLVRWQAAAGLNLTLCHILSGNLALARESMDENLPIVAEHCDNVAGLRNTLVNAFLATQERRFDVARGELNRIRPSHPSDMSRRDYGAWCEYSGELELLCGNLREAEEHVMRGIEIASAEPRDESVIGQSRRLLAEVRLSQRKYSECIEEGTRALDSIRRVGERFEEGIIYRVFGEARMCLGMQPEARADFKQSIEILRVINARLEWAKSCLAAGRCEAFTQRERLAYLIEAERLFGELGIGYWLDATNHELKSVFHERDRELVASELPEADRVESLFVTADPSTLETVRLVERLARTDIAILLTGETGVGKDQLSRLIHAASPRHAGPFLPIDLSTLPETLWESEVFGHRKGAFTGATSDKVGLLESANGGTVFLNEIGNLPKPFQAKLLELLDSNKIRRIGETQPRPLDVRFVAATNVNLREAVTAGTFRADLYYRLAQAPLNLKPLRERRDDILPLLRHFLLEFGVPVSELVLLGRQLWVERAINGHWAGNVRQLRSFVHRLVAIADRPSEPDFPGWAERLLEQIDIIHEPNVGARVSREALLTALERNSWNQRATARDLGITEGGVRHLMRRFEVQRPEAA